MRSGANARVEREKAAMAQVQKMKVMEKNKVLAQKPQAHIENVNVEHARRSTDAKTGLTCAVGNYITGTEETQIAYAEDEVQAICTSTQTNTANAEDNKLATRTRGETLIVRPKDAELLQQENLETQTHDLPATNAKIPIINTNEMSINGQVEQRKEAQSNFTIEKSTKETLRAYADDESLKTETLVSSGGLDVSWLVEQVKGLATADACEVDWLVQEIKHLENKKAMTEAPINADVLSHKADCNTTSGGMLILGEKECIAEATKDSRVGIVRAVASKGDDTNEQVNLSLKKAKSSSTSKDHSGALH